MSIRKGENSHARQKMLYLLLLVTVLLLCGDLVVANQELRIMPRISSVEPTEGLVGKTLIASGENLDQANVAELFMTDGTNDLKIKIVSQTAMIIKFKIPLEAKPGGYRLGTLSKGPPPLEVVQPVRITVLDNSTVK
jgi:hypothetical protein